VVGQPWAGERGGGVLEEINGKVKGTARVLSTESTLEGLRSFAPNRHHGETKQIYRRRDGKKPAKRRRDSRQGKGKTIPAEKGVASWGSSHKYRMERGGKWGSDGVCPLWGERNQDVCTRGSESGGKRKMKPQKGVGEAPEDQVWFVRRIDPSKGTSNSTRRRGNQGARGKSNAETRKGDGPPIGGMTRV